MVRYTLEQRVFLYDTYVKYRSDRKYQRKFRHKFWDSRQKIHNFVNKLTTTGLFFLIRIVGGGIQGPLGTAATNGLLCQPLVIMMMEKSVEWLAGETEVLGENLPQCRFVQTGLLIDKKQNHKIRVLTEEKLDAIGARLEHNT
jgi:hypothetical protein